MEDIHNIQPSDDKDQNGCYLIPIPEEQIKKIKQDIPELSDWQANPLKIKCVSLDRYAKSPYLTGAALLIDIEESSDCFAGYFGCKKEIFNIELELHLDRKTDEFHLNFKIDIPYSPNIIEDITILRKKYNSSFQPEPSCLDEREESRIKDLWTSKEKIECMLSKYEKYEKYMKKRTLIKYKLSDFDWYNKYFKNLCGKEKVSYNGIICGDVDFFFQTSSSVEWWSNSENLAMKVMNALNKQINRGLESKEYSRTGWVRNAPSDFLYSLDTNPDQEFSKIILDAKRITIIGRTAVNILNQYETALKKSLNSGCEYRILAYDYKEKEHPKYSIHSYNNHNTAYDSFMELQKEYSNLIYRETDKWPNYGIFSVEHAQEQNNYIQILLYPHTMKGSQRPMFKITSDNEWYANFSTEIKTLWDNAKKDDSKK